MTYMTINMDNHNHNLQHNKYKHKHKHNNNQYDHFTNDNDEDYLLGLLTNDEDYLHFCHNQTNTETYHQQQSTFTHIVTPELPSVNKHQHKYNHNDQHLILAASIILEQYNDDEFCLEPLPLHYNSSSSSVDTYQSTSTTDTYLSSQSHLIQNTIPCQVDILPTEFDILCGQSRTYSRHAGNRRFQQILDEYLPQYSHQSATKQTKTVLTKEIVARIAMEGGRFLKVKEDGFWEEICTVRARDKVGHALRTKAAALRRKMSKKNTC